MHSPPRPVLTSVAALLAICFATGCASIERAVERSVEDAPATTDRLAWWRAARFGMFVHWGLYAIPAGEWNGRTDYGEWIRANAQIPIDEYESFARHFDPQKFDADRWASLASEAGMKYMVVTTKHHDGFALFDSKVTDFDVMATPFHRDVMAEVATACRSHGLVPCWYHSIMDWHHPDYLPRREFETERSRDGAAFDRFEQYLRAQVTELLSNYGPIGVMWFDGEWEPTWTSERGQRLYDLCRSLQPNVIVNNRVGAGRAGMNGFAEGADTAGDFGTPEQQIPAAPRSGLDWESCLTMNDNWGYNAHDSNFKSTRQLIRTLVDVASKGGNLLLNVGPDANGEIPPKSVERLVGIGRWMKTNGSAIHGTLASPIDAPAGTRITYRLEGGDTRLFLHVFDWPADGHFVVNGLGNTAAGARLLADPTRAIAVKSRPGATSFTIEGGASDPDVSVVELRLSGEPIPYASPTIEAESDLFLDSMLVTVGLPSRALEAHYTLDGSEPTRASAVARGPIAVTDSVALSARAFHGDLHGPRRAPGFRLDRGHGLLDRRDRIDPFGRARTRARAPGFRGIRARRARRRVHVSPRIRRRLASRRRRPCPVRKRRRAPAERRPRFDGPRRGLALDRSPVLQRCRWSHARSPHGTAGGGARQARSRALWPRDTTALTASRRHSSVRWSSITSG